MDGMATNEQIVEDKDEYVKRLSVACCSRGTKDFRQYLNLPLDHGIYYQDDDHPLMNANDHHGNEHIMHFGRCTSELNPKNAISDVLSKTIPGLGLINMVKDAVGSEGCKCCPRTLRSWEVENKENHLDGAPAVARSSELMCIYGGMITITDEPQPDTNEETAENAEENTEETVEEPNILDTLPTSMSEIIQKMNSDADAMAAEVMAWYEENADMLMQLYGCTEEMSAQNYSNNCTQMIPAECMNEAGYITDVSGLSNFNMAGTNAATIGTGCVAAFNALQALGSPIGMADLILGMEKQQTVKGIIDQGPIAVSMCGVGAILTGQGFAVDTFFPTELTEDTMELQEGEVALIGTTRRKSFPNEEKFQKRSRTAGRRRISREEDVCTIISGKRGPVCAEMPDRPITEIFQEKAGSTMMVTKAKKSRSVGKNDDNRKVHSSRYHTTNSNRTWFHPDA